MHINNVVKEMLTLLESVIRTHHAWNSDLTQVEALAKLETLKAVVESGQVHTDAVNLAKDAVETAVEAALNAGQESAQ